MKKQILVLNGHPDPSPKRLCGGLADAYAAGAIQAGHGVERINIGQLTFSLLRNPEDFLTAPLEQDILSAREQMLKANHLVIVYPLWLGGPPALLKGFMEQVARKEFALGAGPHGLPAGKLKGRSARIIVTMGMPALVYRLWFGSQGVKAFNRGILGIAGIKPVRTTYMGGIRPGNCAGLIGRANKLGRQAA